MIKSTSGSKSKEASEGKGDSPKEDVPERCSFLGRSRICCGLSRRFVTAWSAMGIRNQIIIFGCRGCVKRVRGILFLLSYLQKFS